MHDWVFRHSSPESLVELIGIIAVPDGHHIGADALDNLRGFEEEE